MTVIIAIFLFILGAVMGSFVGAMTWRMKHHKDWIKGRSECEHCHHKLSPLDLIPVISWIALGGKCRYCHKPIGWSAIILEVSLGMAFVLSFYFLPMGLGANTTVAGLLGFYVNLSYIVALILWYVILVIMWALMTYDAKWHLLPNKLMFPLVGATAIFALVNYLWVQNLGVTQAAINVGLGLIPVAGVYLLLWLVSRGAWIGLGDVKFGIAVGLLMPWPQALLVLALANTLGTLAVVPGLIRKKLKPTTQIPFGPYLIVATVIAMLWGNLIVKWVAKLLLIQ